LHSELNVPATFSREVRVGKPLGNYFMVEGLQTKWASSATALHLASKRIAHEVIPLMYQRYTFYIQSKSAMANLVKHVPRKYLKQIRRLRVDHRAYGNPKYTRDTFRRDKHTKAWTTFFRTLPVPALEELEVNVYVRGPQRSVSPSDYWVAPLLELRARRDRIKHLDIVMWASEAHDSKQMTRLRMLDRTLTYFVKHFYEKCYARYRRIGWDLKAIQDMVPLTYFLDYDDPTGPSCHWAHV
jgi:hypothetical protein